MTMSNMPTSIHVKINKNAPKTGRPRGKAADSVRSTPRSRKEYRTFKKKIAALSQRTLRDYVDQELLRYVAPSITHKGLSLAETRQVIDRIPRRYEDKVHVKPKYARGVRVTLSRNVMFLLPLETVNACAQLFKKKGWKERIEVDCDSSQESVRRDESYVPQYEVSEPGKTEYVVIKGVGKFSRDQIGDMLKLWEMSRAVDATFSTIIWMQTGIPDIPERVRAIKMLEEAHPYRKVLGVSCDLMHSQLESLRERQWVTGAVLLAFCSRMHVLSGGRIRTIESPTADSRAFDLPDHMKRSMRLSPTSDIFLPINVGRYHWVCILIHMRTRTILCYDPQGRTASLASLELHGQRIATEIFPGFRVLNSTKPQQKDGTSCGIFVALVLYNSVHSTPWTDFSEFGIVLFRFKMLSILLD